MCLVDAQHTVHTGHGPSVWADMVIGLDQGIQRRRMLSKRARGTSLGFAADQSNLAVWGLIELIHDLGLHCPPREAMTNVQDGRE